MDQRYRQIQNQAAPGYLSLLLYPDRTFRQPNLISQIVALRTQDLFPV